MPTIPIRAAACAAVMLSAPAMAQDAPTPADRSGALVEVSAGMEYQRGDFGTGETFETISAPVGLALQAGRVRIAASVSYVRTTAPADVIVSQGGLLGTPILARETSQRSARTRSGLGDTTIEASYDLPLPVIVATIGAGVKLPTASAADGLGTGEPDYAINGQIALPVGPVTPFATAGYTVLGEPEQFDLRNAASASAGARIRLGGAAQVVIAYSYEQSPVATLGDRQSVALGLGTSLGGGMRLGLEGGAGLSKSAPDLRLGVRLGFGL